MNSNLYVIFLKFEFKRHFFMNNQAEMQTNGFAILNHGDVGSIIGFDFIAESPPLASIQIPLVHTASTNKVAPLCLLSPTVTPDVLANLFSPVSASRLGANLPALVHRGAKRIVNQPLGMCSTSLSS